MHPSRSYRPSYGKTLIIIGALFAPTLAMSSESGPHTEGVGLPGAAMSAPSRTPAPDPLANPVNDRVNWAGFVADVLENRVTSAVDTPVSVEFFMSLFRAVSWGSAPGVDGAYTLFLPIDSAFSQTSGERLDALIHNPEALRSLIGAHIVSGRLTEADLERGGVFTSLSGDRIAADWTETPSVNGAAVIGTTELEHGVVHVIDRLL